MKIEQSIGSQFDSSPAFFDDGITYLSLAKKATDVLPELIENNSVYEAEVLQELFAFLSTAHEIARQLHQDALIEQIDFFTKNLVYVDRKSFTTACKGLAEHWCTLLLKGQRVCIFANNEYKSDPWVAANVLAELDDLLATLTSQQKRELKKNITLFVGKQTVTDMAIEILRHGAESSTIIAVDDLMITGISTRNSLGSLARKLVESGVYDQNSVHQHIEANVLCGGKGPYKITELDTFRIFTNYFLKTTDKTPPVFGWWKSPDYGFREVIYHDIYQQLQVQGMQEKVHRPRAIEMQRPYKGWGRSGYNDIEARTIWNTAKKNWQVVVSDNFPG